MTDQPSAVEFEIEFYKSHRAHELVLTNAEATLEQSLLRFYFLVNAGSLGAFIAFVQGNWREFEQDTTFSIHAIWAMFFWGQVLGCPNWQLFFGMRDRRLTRKPAVSVGKRWRWTT